MPTIHLPIGGSTAERTLHCPVWLERAKKAPKRPSSAFADEGNLLHDAMEAWQGDSIPFKEMIGKLKYNDQVLTEELYKTLLAPAATALNNLLDDYSVYDEVLCEPFVQYIPDEADGSIDVLARSQDGKTVIIADYKFGQAPVKVENNSQLQFYALCARTDPQTAY